MSDSSFFLFPPFFFFLSFSFSGVHGMRKTGWGGGVNMSDSSFFLFLLSFSFSGVRGMRKTGFPIYRLTRSVRPVPRAYTSTMYTFALCSTQRI